MHGFGLDHSYDKNNAQVGGNLFHQHQSHAKAEEGFVVACDPKAYTVDVKLISLIGTGLQPHVLHNVRVGTERGGDGHGEHNLPWIGQMVKVEFQSGVGTSQTRAVITKRYYNGVHKPPSHPLLNDGGYMKGYFFQSEGGSFVFDHADGQTTKFHLKPQNVEGSKTNARATGVAKTAAENRMDKASAKMAKAGEQLKRVTDVGASVASLTKELQAFTDLAALVQSRQT